MSEVSGSWINDQEDQLSGDLGGSVSVGARMWTRRRLLDGIRWRVRVGAPWRDVPERYGHWQSIYPAVSPLAADRGVPGRSCKRSPTRSD